MALAKDRMINSNIIQDIVGLEKTGTPKNSSLLSAMSLQSNGVVFRAEEAHGSTVINFKTTTGYSTSLLSFEQSQQRANSKITNSTSHKDEYSNWDDNLNHNVYHEYPRMSADFINCFQTASSDSCSKLGNRDGDESSYGWLYSESTVCADSFEESATPAEPGFHKRHQMERVRNQLRSNALIVVVIVHLIRNPSRLVSKDPQSIAAKNRRERISERLKILQELVPNGSKVDLVTMLEKAISYVKFLQLQVKVLATDEFWPVQGGKLLIFLK
ncbi:hypothetical protein FNV43_RR14035 [Rhamnella rubrinervis]|uniref:BHLH domain-containing protein n=1 Tax=Rhamnella rubrinervis TaxID=2594499 RepID=A0A8K0H2A6_9ROSA|nr:hypothetical protein FNV43_RR14035 [Rhamnella rubrinervis]